MESHSPAEAARLLGPKHSRFDKEMLARYIGDVIWDFRRYADSHIYYMKAWEAALELDIEEGDRNLRRARASAGVMASACTMRNWALADQAMAELKERYKKVAPSEQGGLKYWIDTGEPRLKSRKC